MDGQRTGYRTLTAGHLTAAEFAAQFDGQLPDGFTHPKQLIEDLETAGDAVPWPRECNALLRFLMGRVHAGTWRKGRAIVKTSNADCADALGITVRHVQRQLHQLETYAALARTEADQWGERTINLAPLTQWGPRIRELARQQEDRRRRLRALGRKIQVAMARIAMVNEVMTEHAPEEVDEIAAIVRQAHKHHLRGEDARDEQRMMMAAAEIEVLAAAAEAMANRVLEPTPLPSLDQGESSPRDVGVIHTPTTHPSPVSTETGTQKARQHGVVGSMGADPHAPKSLPHMRKALSAAYPRFVEILAVVHPNPDTDAALLAAAEILRQEMRMNKAAWYQAMEIHGWDVVVAATVVARARPDDEIHVRWSDGTPNRAAYLRGALAKPNAATGENRALRPWPSIFALAENIDLQPPARSQPHEGGLDRDLTLTAVTEPGGQTGYLDVAASWRKAGHMDRLRGVDRINRARQKAGELPMPNSIASNQAIFDREVTRWKILVDG